MPTVHAQARRRTRRTAWPRSIPALLFCGALAHASPAVAATVAAPPAAAADAPAVSPSAAGSATPPAPPAAASAAAAPLTLQQALSLAQQRSAQLQAQALAAQASAAAVGPAGENPDPQLIVGVENLPIQGADRFRIGADGMTMRRIGVMQEFVRSAKRAQMGSRAQAEARREAALLQMQASELRQQVAAAWLERLYAERSLALVQALAQETTLQIEAATARLAAGSGEAAEPLMARSSLAQLADQRLELQGKARAAQARLARWLGEADAARPPADEPDITQLPHTLTHPGDMMQHPQLAMLAPMTAAADAEAALAAIATQPDWSVELSYGARGNGAPDMVTLMFRVGLPLFASARQEPAALAKARQAEQARAQAEEAQRRYSAELQAMRAEHDTALARLARYEADIVPLAQASAQAQLAAYAGGRATLPQVLQARRELLQARLMALGLRAEAARIWAQLNHLVTDGSTP